VLLFFLTSCSAFAVQNPIVAQNMYDSESARKKNDSISKTWQMRINDSQVRTAVVMTNGKTPNGEAQTIFWLQCPADQKYVVAIHYIVRNSSKITDFDFASFEGPGAPGSEKKLVEFRVVSPNGKLSFRDSVAGWYGGAGEADAFVFGTGATKQDKIMQLARLVAKGSAEVTFIVHDYQDYRKTIETTFPAIDPSSDVAKFLNGCRM
ncbi:MAG TPA: hypothetical protein VK308_15690, partial [Pyrinomonadaceae bacterium]|nr:hypothetical protein [Pyrinomonadaceae bacterium]